jgi:hypothetical protein
MFRKTALGLADRRTLALLTLRSGLCIGLIFPNAAIQNPVPAIKGTRHNSGTVRNYATIASHDVDQALLPALTHAQTLSHFLEGGNGSLDVY